ncbi:MAG: cadmium-translocating P-type ATPase [Methylocystaceae bacterium]|nr:cadmium-translocating P-type ATPase [Methylocystaceae bacterium]
MLRAYKQARIVHETPKRLRVRIEWLNRKLIDASHISTLLERMAGVEDARVNKGAKSAIIRYDGLAHTRISILDFLDRLEPTSLPHVDRMDGEAEHFFHTSLNGIALAATPFLSPTQRLVVAGALVAPTLWAGVESLFSGKIKVELLDAIAIGVATSRGDAITALSTNFFIHLGELLEARTNNSSNALLRQLLHPAPSNAWKEVNGELLEVGADQLQLNDVVVVNPGDTIPVDGQVLTGMAQVNEASVTGESVPVNKEMKMRVLSGTIVEEGTLRIRAVKVGDDTTTARISRFIQESLENKSETQKNAEKKANQRIWITLGLGALTFALTRDWTRVASVFLVDYSCALKLSTPVAMKSTMYKCAKDGILVKGGQAIETFANVDTVVFDKTGTLTHGELDVTEIRSVQPKEWPEDRLLALVASIEEHSTHPVANAVVTQAKARQLAHISHDEVNFIVAHGMVSEVNDKRIVIGSRHFLEEHENVDISSHENMIEELEEKGLILLYTSMDSVLTGIVGLRDQLRDDAKSMIERLYSNGVEKVAILTGDRRRKAQALADQLGITDVYAELRPEEKADIVQKLKEEGRVIAFVGDGVNDAPALINANVGIAMPQGADLARASADIVLTVDNISGVAQAYEKSTDTMKLIKSNFNWAVGINSGLFVGASMGLTSPVISSLLHNGTTLGVLARALSGVKDR